ncbi:MAG: GNAT family N-acetyltransferase [Bacteroidota bacterium]
MSKIGSMHIRSLQNIEFNTIIACFLEAFAGYFVQMPTDAAYYRDRWQRAKVDYSLSFGMFDAERLVGFVIHAVDKRNGKLVAYNTGTGVVPEYRGNGIVDALYAHALPLLQKRGIESCTLEVITKNAPALKVYQRIGFKISKQYHCYHGDISKMEKRIDFTCKKADFAHFDWNRTNQASYSWDNHIESIRNGGFELHTVYGENQLESFFVISAEAHYLAQFDVLNGDDDSWERLFLAIREVSQTVKINNVDTLLRDKVTHLNQLGLKNTIDQYEMELVL